MKMWRYTILAVWVVVSNPTRSVVADTSDVLSPRGLRQAGITSPIDVHPKTLFEDDYLIAHNQWCQRNLIEPFKKYALKGDAWNADARLFVEEALPLWEVGEGDVPPELTALGKTILDAGCDDPLVAFLWASLRYREADNWRESLPVFRKALNSAETSMYPKALSRLIAMEMRDTERRGGRNVNELDKRITSLTQAALEDGSYTIRDEQLFVRHVLRGEGRKYMGGQIDDLHIIFEAAPLSDWAKLTLLGAAEIRLGWNARGGAYAHLVTEEGWEGFDDFLTGARHLLVNAWELRPDRPEPTIDMIKIVMAGRGEPEDTLRLWFDRAITAQFDYLPAYRAVLWALRPRWGGSHPLMLEFAQSCLDTGRFDTSVPSVYFKTLSDIYSETGNWRGLYRRADIAPNVMRLSKALLEEPTRQYERHLHESMFAVNAWMAGYFDEAIQQWRQLDDTLHPLALKKLARFHIDESWFKAEMAILAGPARDDFILAEYHYARFETEEAIRLYEKVQRQLNAYGPADHIINVRLESLLIEEDLEKGDWVAIPASRDLWNIIRGDWTISNKEGLVNKGTDDNALIVSSVRVGPDFEVRGTFRIDARRDCCKTFGIAVGYRESRIQGWRMCQVWQAGTSPLKAAIAAGFSSTKNHVPASLLDENTFRVRVYKRGIYYFLNDKMIKRDNIRHFGPHEGAYFLVGFGARKFCRQNVTFVRNVEVRRLLPEPDRP